MEHTYLVAETIFFKKIKKLIIIINNKGKRPKKEIKNCLTLLKKITIIVSRLRRKIYETCHC